MNEPISNIALLEKSIGAAISQGLSAPWLPHYCRTKGFRNRGRASVPYASVNLEILTAGGEKGETLRLIQFNVVWKYSI